MMKPKSQGPHDEGLLEYLEDIIGSNRHVERIEEGAKKCARLRSHRVSRVCAFECPCHPARGVSYRTRAR
jgi:structural maintenance of chromosome 4